MSPKELCIIKRASREWGAWRLQSAPTGAEESTGERRKTSVLLLSNLYFLYLAALFLEVYHKLWDILSEE